eukprot:11181953-Lingulodinium_polyedra.AAC.1
MELAGRPGLPLPSAVAFDLGLPPRGLAPPQRSVWQQQQQQQQQLQGWEQLQQLQQVQQELQELQAHGA